MTRTTILSSSTWAKTFTGLIDRITAKAGKRPVQIPASISAAKTAPDFWEDDDALPKHATHQPDRTDDLTTPLPPAAGRDADTHGHLNDACGPEDDPTADEAEEAAAWEEAYRAGLLNGPELDDWPASPSQPQHRAQRSVPSPRVTPPLRKALAALHLARVVSPLSALHAPGAITVLDAETVEFASTLADVVTEYALPAGVPVRTAAPAACDQNGLLIVKPPTGKAAEAQKTFLQTLRATLQGTEPCLILFAEGLTLPADLARFLPPPLALPPLDRAALRALIQVMFPAVSEAEITRACAALPQSPLPLSPEAVALAFRATTPLAVVQTLLAQKDRLRSLKPPSVTLAQCDPEQAAVQAARQAVCDLTDWRKGKLAWSDVPNGLLLYGPPGTGKTLLARAIAAEAKLPIIEVTAAQWQEGSSLGPFLEKMHASFAEADRAAPCIFFIDEIDTFGNRAERNHNSSYNDQVVAGFLVAVTKLREVEGVLLVAATNRIEGMDPAILRPGRFDLKHPLTLPSRAGVRAVLDKLLAKDRIPQAAKADLTRRALGRSPADIDAAIRSARAACRKDGKRLTAARIADHLTGGMTQPPGLPWRIAIHEAGHAAVAIRLGMAVTRIVAGATGGRVEFAGRQREGLAPDYAAEIAVQLAGRAAEEVLLGEASSGAGGSEISDLAQATQLAMDLELRTGLGATGLLWQPAPLQLMPHDRQIRAQLEAHLQTGLETARILIARMPRLVEGLAEALFREGELSGRALDTWTKEIRVFDPHIIDQPPGTLVIFPGPRAGAAGREDTEGPGASV
jgi:hypothetical protein